MDKGGGYLTLTRPWPSMLRGIYGDPERYRDTYWSRFEGRYFAGDGAKIDEDGYLWLLGRVDDVMNVSGHRISTTEVESALVDHYLVAESAVVGAVDPTTGQSIVAFVTLVAGAGAERRARPGAPGPRGREDRPIARPKTVVFTDELPKTRSGKIMRRLLRDVAEGRVLGDTTTLADPAVVEEIRRSVGRPPPPTSEPEPFVPSNWAWRDGPVEHPGPAVVFDVDGVLSDAVGRQHFIERGRRDWEAFFNACGDDPVIGELARVLELLDPTLQVVLLTGRPMRVQPQTLAWLERYGLRWDLLVMRSRGDYSQVDLVQARTASTSCGRTGSTSGWPSRTIPTTSPCSTPRASRACTSTPATTTDGDRSDRLRLPAAAVVPPPPRPASSHPATSARPQTAPGRACPRSARRGWSRPDGTGWRRPPGGRPSTERSISTPRLVTAALKPVGAACRRSRPCCTACTSEAAISWVGTWAVA